MVRVARSVVYSPNGTSGFNKWWDKREVNNWGCSWGWEGRGTPLCLTGWLPPPPTIPPGFLNIRFQWYSPTESFRHWSPCRRCRGCCCLSSVLHSLLA
jgi:hypothetical protein